MLIIQALVTHAAPCFALLFITAIVIKVRVLNRRSSATEVAAALMAAPVRIKDRISHLKNKGTL